MRFLLPAALAAALLTDPAEARLLARTSGAEQLNRDRDG
jgi:hypothetical protein